jgi:hypothetical protein
MAADRDRGAVGGHVQQVHHPVASSVDVPHAGLGWRLHRICPPGQRGGVQQQVGDCGEPLVKGARPGPRVFGDAGEGRQRRQPAAPSRRGPGHQLRRRLHGSHRLRADRRVRHHAGPRHPMNLPFTVSANVTTRGKPVVTGAAPGR